MFKLRRARPFIDQLHPLVLSQLRMFLGLLGCYFKTFLASLGPVRMSELLVCACISTGLCGSDPRMVSVNAANYSRCTDPDSRGSRPQGERLQRQPRIHVFHSGCAHSFEISNPSCSFFSAQGLEARVRSPTGSRIWVRGRRRFQDGEHGI